MTAADPKHNPVFNRLRGDAAAGSGVHEMIPMRDGVKLFLQSWTPPAAERVVVCFHGAGGQGQFFSMFADVLVPRGAAVFVADYRGHGLSEGPRGDFSSFEVLLADCHEVVQLAMSRLPGKPLVILGESMGGCMAVNYTARHQDIVSALVLFSPALKFANTAIPLNEILKLPIYLLAAVFAPGLPLVPISGNEEKGIKNPVHIEFDRTDPHHLKLISTRYFLQLNRYMSHALTRCPSMIKTPVILFQGGSDSGISPDGAKLFIDSLASPDKELVIYPEGLHVLLTDPGAAGVAERLSGWVTSH